MLDEIYISARYPGELGLLPYGKPTFEDAFHFYTSAKDIFIEISNFLKTEE